MPALPPSSDFTGAAVTEGQFKTALTSLRGFLADLLGTTGTQAAALAALGALSGSQTSKSSNYTVVAADRGKVIECTATLTLSLTAAATLGAAFSFVVANVGTGLVTIDPNSSETINGATTIIVGPGEQVIVRCSGSNFWASSSFDLLNLTEDAEPDPAADYAIVWDASLKKWNKSLLEKLGGGGMKLLASGATASGASLTISSIPGNYTDLVLVLKDVSPSATGNIFLQFNGDTASNYTYSYLAMISTTPSWTQARSKSTQLVLNSFSAAANTYAAVIRIPQYSATNMKKIVFAHGAEFGSTITDQILSFGAWDSNSAINSILIDPPGNFDAGSYELWGVK